MSESNQHHHLIAAYERMLERVKTAIESLDEHTKPSVHHAIELARKTAIELKELERDDANKVAAALRRDLHTSGKYLQATGKALGDWLDLDWMLVEARLWQLFLSVADKTQLEWVELQHHLDAGPDYHAGEIACMGTLRCAKCGHLLRSQQIIIIPPCSECHATRFTRVK